MLWIARCVARCRPSRPCLWWLYVEQAAAFDGIRASAGNSFALETEVPLFFKGTYDPGFAIALHCKVGGRHPRVHVLPGSRARHVCMVAEALQ